MVQQCLAENTVETFDVNVEIARLDAFNDHAIGFRPPNEYLIQELRYVVQAQHLRQSVLAMNLLDHTDASVTAGVFGNPASAYLRIDTIWISVNLEVFIGIFELKKR